MEAGDGPRLAADGAHHTTTKHLCSPPGSATFFIRLRPHTKMGAMFLKNIYIYILKGI